MFWNERFTDIEGKLFLWLLIYIKRVYRGKACGKGTLGLQWTFVGMPYYRLHIHIHTSATQKFSKTYPLGFCRGVKIFMAV